MMVVLNQGPRHRFNYPAGNITDFDRSPGPRTSGELELVLGRVLVRVRARARFNLAQALIATRGDRSRALAEAQIAAAGFHRGRSTVSVAPCSRASMRPPAPHDRAHRNAGPDLRGRLSSAPPPCCDPAMADVPKFKRAAPADATRAEISKPSLPDPIGPGDLRAPAIARRIAVEKPIGAIGIDPPNLDDGAIIPDNIRSAAALYFTAMLDEMKFFQVADKVVEQFTAGMLPLSRGPAAERIYHWFRDVHLRLSESDRRVLYRRVLGLGAPAGSPDTNSQFTDLWRSFLAAATQAQAGGDLRPATLAARALAINLTAHGYGLGVHAIELTHTVQELRGIFGEPDLLAAYAARDPWQLIERVRTAHLGASGGIVRLRIMSQTGSTILGWLADHPPHNRATVLPIAAIADDVARWLAVADSDAG